MHPLHQLAAALAARDVRYILMGVAAVNYWATAAAQIFSTQDYDLLLPVDADNLLRAWQGCEQCGLALLAGGDLLDAVRDHFLAERVLAARAVTRATDGQGFDVDLSFEMAGFDFSTVWEARRIFKVEGAELPVARLRQIVESKARAGRAKDRLFLATHAEALRQLLGDEKPT